MSKSYLEKTVAVLKHHNFMVQKVERFNVYGGVRQDLYGFIDVLAIHPHYGTIGVQICGQDWSSHIKKLTGERREAVILWLLAGNRCLLIGWRELKTGWEPRTKEFTLAADFPEITSAARTKLAAIPADPIAWLSSAP